MWGREEEKYHIATLPEGATDEGRQRIDDLKDEILAIANTLPTTKLNEELKRMGWM